MIPYRAGRYDGIYRATVEMCLPGEIWPYRFNRGILLFRNPIDLFLDNDLRTILHPSYYTVTRQNNRHSSKNTSLTILLPFRDFRKKKIVLHANRTFKFQVLRSNPLLADFKLQRLTITLNYRTTCRMI